MILISEQRNAETLRSFLGASVFIERDVVGKLLYSEQAITGLHLKFYTPSLEFTIIYIPIYIIIIYKYMYIYT